MPGKGYHLLTVRPSQKDCTSPAHPPGSKVDRGSCFEHRCMRPPGPGTTTILKEAIVFFAGIDWADDHYDVAVLDQQGHLVGSTRVTHSSAGLAQLKAFLLDIAGDPQQIPCFVETNHGLLIPSLLEAGFPVYPLNPKTVDRRRKPAGAKTDAIDAYLLARTGRSDLADLRPLQPDSPLVQELKALSRDLEALIHSQTRLVHQPQLQADRVTTRTKSRLMLVLVGQLALLVDQIKAYDQEIHHFFGLHPDSSLFCSLPGAGKRLAPKLLAEWGDDRERYTGAGSIQALAGTSPVAYQSGNYRKAHKRYACVKPLRNALHQFAWQSTLREAWAGAFYQRKRAEGKSHSMAVRALANLWVRIIYAMWLKHEPYDAATFLAARQAHARVAA